MTAALFLAACLPVAVLLCLLRARRRQNDTLREHAEELERMKEEWR